MPLKEYSDDELKAELDRRIKKDEIKLPQELEQKDWSMVESLCRGYLDSIREKGWVDEDMAQYIFEAAIEAVYGKKVFEFINKKRG